MIEGKTVYEEQKKEIESLDVVDGIQTYHINLGFQNKK